MFMLMFVSDKQHDCKCGQLCKLGFVADMRLLVVRKQSFLWKLVQEKKKRRFCIQPFTTQCQSLGNCTGSSSQPSYSILSESEATQQG
jgi:hypothetical protein